MHYETFAKKHDIKREVHRQENWQKAHGVGENSHDSYSEASNEEPKYLEPIEQPSIHSTRSPGTNIIISLLIRFPTKCCSFLSAPLCFSFRFNLTVKSTSPGKSSCTSPL